MKIIFYLLALVLVISSCSKNNKQVGTWKGKSFLGNKEELTTFRKDGKVATARFNQQTNKYEMLGADEPFVAYDKKFFFKYEMDESKDPAWYDFIMLENDKEIVRQMGILKFESDSVMIIRFNAMDSIRPVNFNLFSHNDSSNCYRYTRVQTENGK